MAKRSKRRFHSKPKMTIPLAIVGGFVPMGAKLLNDWRAYGDINIITRELGQMTTGFDWTTGKWSFNQLKFGAFPIIAGFAIHKLAGKFGINRAIAKAGIPLIRI